MNNIWNCIIIVLLLIVLFTLLRRPTMQGTFTLTFNIAPAPVPLGIAQSSFSATQGTAFTGTIDPISGGTAPYVVTGDLSALGLAIDAAGNITGTPTVSGQGLTATIQIADSQA